MLSRIEKNKIKKSQKGSKASKTEKKKHYFRKLLVTLVILALIISAALFGVKHFIQEKAETAISQQVLSNNGLKATGNLTKLPAMSPAELTQALNSYSSEIVSKSQGYVEAANASFNGSTVTYSLKSNKLNSMTAEVLNSVAGDQLQSMADQALNSMSKNGTANPKVIIKLTDENGNSLKTLTYTK